jgi:hypothetical protein
MKTIRIWRPDEYVLAEIDDFNRELELARQNRALMKFLHARARQTETASSEEAGILLGLATSGGRRKVRRPANGLGAQPPPRRLRRSGACLG